MEIKETEVNGPPVNSEFYQSQITGRIVEVQFLPDCILSRPVNPALYYDIKRHDEEEFAAEYKKYEGSLEVVAGYLKEQVAQGITIH